MLYQDYAIGGELFHSAKGNELGNHKYVDKVRTKSGKWRYIYENTKNYKKNAAKLRVSQGLYSGNPSKEKNEYSLYLFNKYGAKYDPHMPMDKFSSFVKDSKPGESVRQYYNRKSNEYSQDPYNKTLRRDSVELQKKVDDSIQGKIDKVLKKIENKKKKK